MPVPLNDGQCWTMGDVRTCPGQIDKCGRSSPCIVPLIVHSIFRFSGNGDEAKLLDKAHEEMFADALGEAICFLGMKLKTASSLPLQESKRG